MAPRELFVKCPKCSSQFHYYASEYRPFCSERCKMIDLGHWLQENYKISPSGPSEDEDNLEEEDGDKEN